MPQHQPNIVFIMSDDHASHAMSCYGSRINQTPQLDRIAQGGMRFDNCFCTNAICGPSRAAMLTGTYNHVNGVTTLRESIDNTLEMFPQLLQAQGYQTALFGKWHLGQGAAHCPTGFDDWAVLPGQGRYHYPDFIFKGPDGGERRTLPGYVTDVITDLSLDWLEQRDRDRPFCLLCHHKAPHRSWEPDEKHAHLYLNEHIPEPDTLYDDYADRASAAKNAIMRVGRDMRFNDVKCQIPKPLPEAELRRWAYQRYIKDYLRVVASIDDNVGRMLDYLDSEELTENTVVIYTSDQGFFLGDHGWFDKRFMYEQSLRMPMLLRYPAEVPAGSANQDMVLNVDIAPLLLDLADAPIPEHMQGRSFRPIWNGQRPSDWRESMYYHYWMYDDKGHPVYAHYGVRTQRYKLVYYYARVDESGGLDPTYEPEWELFDLETDPQELCSVYAAPAYADTVDRLKRELTRLQAEVGDAPGDPSPYAAERMKQAVG